MGGVLEPRLHELIICPTNSFDACRFGHPRDEIVGKSVSEVLGDAAMVHLRPHMERALRGDETRFQAKVPYRDGGTRWVDARYVPDHDARGKVRGFFVLVLDVSESKQAEEQLRHSNERTRQVLAELQATYDQSPVGMLQLDQDLRYVRVNEALAAMNGIPAAEHIGKTIRDIVPDLAPRIEAEFRRVLTTGEPVLGVEVTGETKADPGQPHTWLESWFPLRDADGAVVGLNVVAQDITARKRAESALRESEQRFRMLADNMSQLAWTCDRLGNVTWYNRRWLEYTGMEFEDMKGWDWSKVQHPDHLERVVARVKHSAETGEPWEDTFPLRGRDGTYRWFLSRAVPIRDEADRIVCWFGTNTDVTELRDAQQALREADRRKDEFLAVLAHELRNPLAPIRNSLHVLRMTSESDSAAGRVVEMLERQVNHMVRMVDDLMEVSRITRGKIELRKEPVELASVVRGAVETSRPLIEAAGHQLAVAIPPEPLTLVGDPVRLSQVIANLLNNAAKYTEPGGQIWLSVRRESDGVAISVRDTGTGIPPEMLPRVFDLFMQIDRHSVRAQGGLGIGLALVKSLVEMHGGSVRAHSDGPGRGSEFVVRLPLAVSQRPADIPGRQATPPTVLAARRVLVVDDNRDAAQSLGTLLKLLGADVHVAYSGPEALAALAGYKPAVVLLDIGMPGMDGHEVARRIREQSEFQDVTLIALTGWGQEEDRRRSRSAGFDHHLIKPADVSALQTLLISLESNAGSQQTKR